MSVQFGKVVLRGCALLLMAGAVMLSGCGAGLLAGSSDTPGFKIKGNVHGGAYPIQNATVRLMQTKSSGIWSTTTNSYVGNAQQILSTTSDSNGSFTFPDTFTCAANQYVYIEVSGGNTTSSTNSNVIQLGVVGSCSGNLATTTAIDNVNVFISELSTVAAAYALNDFLSFSTSNGDTLANITASATNNSATPGCSGSGKTGSNAMTCVQAGLANAFLNAYNLVDSVRYDGSFPTGQARAAIPNNAQSVVPESLINTLGNILQSCVDSGGGTVATYSSYTPGNAHSTPCGDLFYYTTPPGSTTPPTTTLQAILNIANYPTNNVDQLFLLQPRSVFFAPSMSSDRLSGSSRLMAYTISIFYNGTGLPHDSGLPYPVDVALDANDNAYVAYSGDGSGTTYGAVDEFAPNGVGAFAGAHQSTLPNPGSLALDGNASAWLSNDALTNGNVYQINTPSSGGTTGAIGQILPVPYGFAAGVAVDLTNNVWTIRDSAANQSIYRFDAGNSYAPTLTATPTLGAAGKRLLVDYNQNALGVTSNTDPLGNTLTTVGAQVWLLNYNTDHDAATFHTATLNASNGYGLAISNADYPYLPLNGELDTETGTGSGTVNPNGNGSYTSASSTGVSYSNPLGVAMDGAGALYWSDSATAGQIFRFAMSSSPSATNGTLTSFLPCFPLKGVCDSASVANLRGMAIDSSGAMWYLSDGATGRVIQTLGVATPTFPLLSYAHAGIVP